MVKMEFVPHISREILLGPSMSSLRNVWPYYDRKEFPFLMSNYSRIEKVMVRNRKMTLSMSHPWSKISCDKRDMTWLYNRLHHVIDPHMNWVVVMSC